MLNSDILNQPYRGLIVHIQSFEHKHWPSLEPGEDLYLDRFLSERSLESKGVFSEPDDTTELSPWQLSTSAFYAVNSQVYFAIESC